MLNYQRVYIGHHSFLNLGQFKKGNPKSKKEARLYNKKVV
jgi:hypothetical protein